MAYEDINRSELMIPTSDGIKKTYVETSADQVVMKSGRSLESALNDVYINVKDFGAKGDGVTDDLSAIQAAIATSSEGKTLYFPSGRYYISSRLSIGKSIGMKFDFVTIETDIVDQDNSGFVVMGSGSDGVTVTGTLSITHKNPESSRGSCLVVSSTSRVSLDGVSISGFGEAGVVVTSSQEIKIENFNIENVMTNLDSPQLGAISVTSSTLCRIYNASIKNVGGKGIALRSSNDCKIVSSVVNTTTKDAGDGIYCNNCKNVNIENCSVTNPQGNCVKLSRQSKNILASGCQLIKSRGVGQGFKFQGTIECSLVGSYVNSTSTDDIIRIDPHPIEDVGGPSRNNSVIGCTIVGEGNSAGVIVTGTNSELYAKSVVVSGNTIKNTRIGVSVSSGEDVIVSNNVFDGVSVRWVSLQGSTNTVIKGNILKSLGGSATIGVMLSGSNKEITIEGNTLESKTSILATGINAGSENINVVISNNVFSGEFSNNLVLSNIDSVVIGNMFAAGGISITSSKVKVLSNTHPSGTLPGLGTSVESFMNGSVGFRNSVRADILINDNTKGVLLRSPNNSTYRLVVGDDGNLSTTKV